MSIRVQSLVWDRFDSGGSELLLALKLADICNDDGSGVFMRVETLAAATRQSERTVQRQLSRMVDRGFLIVSKHAEGGRGHAREFSVNLEWLRGRGRVGRVESPDGEARDLSVANCEKTAQIKGAKMSPFSDKGCQTVHERVTRLSPFTEPPYIRNPSLPIPPTPQWVGGVVVDAFERWWQRYPSVRRVAKSKCRRHWERQGLDAKAEQLMRALREDCQSEQWRKEGGQFVPMPFTWLNQERYERESGLVAPLLRKGCAVCGAEARYAFGGSSLCGEHYDQATERAKRGD